MSVNISYNTSLFCGGIKIHGGALSVCIFYTRMGCIYSNALTHIASYKPYIRHIDFESMVTFIRPFPINPSDRDMCYDRGSLNELSRIYYGM